MLSGDLTDPISLNYATSDGSAVAGDDYALTTGTLTLSSGATSFTFTVNILEDLDNVDVELAGVFSVALSVVDMLPAGVSLTSSVATVMIIDNDQPTMPGAVTATLSLARVTLLEGETATVEIRLTGNAPEDLTFTLELDSVSGEVTNSDYILTPIVALIPAGANRATVSIFAVNDSDPEAVESFTLRLESISTRVAIGTTGSITVTIPENDKPAGITVTPITPVTEGDPIIVEVVLDAVSSDTVTVILVDAFTGSAEAGGVDYTLPVRLSEQITIGETRAIFRISTTLNDFLYEGDETVDLEFSVMGSSIVVPATALIRDADQAPTVSFAPSQPTMVIESSSVGILLRLGDAQLVSDLTVEFEVGLASTATSADYVVGSSVVIAAGEPFVMLTLTAASDRVYDGGVRETVELRLTGVSGGGLPGITLGSRITHVVSIIDAQIPPLVSFAASQPTTVAEGSSVDILVELDGALTDDAVVVDFTVSGTADEGVDYDSPGTRVTILPGEVTGLISLVARADNRYDGGMTETVELVLTAASGGVILSDSVTHAVTIIDNEQLVTPLAPADLTATLSVESVTLLEGETRQFEIRLTANALSNLTFTLDYVPGGSAQAGDYSLSPTVIVIGAGSDRVTVELEADDDVLVEGEESFMLELMSVLSRVAIGTTGTLMVTIPENDQQVPPAVDVTATLSQASIMLLEGETRQFEIRLTANAPSNLTFTLDYVPGGSAQADDYSLSPTVIVIGAGSDRVTVELEADDDVLVEGEESFMLELMSVLSRVAIGTTGTLMVTIVDNDEASEPVGIEIGFDSATYRVNEDAGSLTLMVSVISGVLTETLRLSYAVSDVSTTGSDYTVSGNMLELSLMTPSVTISVDIRDDASDEPEEAFRVELSGAPAGITLDPATATVTIIDDDPTPMPEATHIEFVVLTATINEGDVYEIELRLVDSKGNPLRNSQDVSATLVVFPADTTLLDDEYLFSRTVNIPADQITGTAQFRSVKNTGYVTLQIKEVTVVSQNSRDMLRINVNPPPPPVPVVIGFKPYTYTVVEGAVDVMLTVSVISGDLTQTLTLNYDTADDSAMDPADYTNSTGTLTLSDTTTTVTFTVTIIDDEVPESTEIFFVYLTSVVSLPVGVTLDPVTATVSIIDNDAVVVTPTFSLPSVTLSEGGGVDLEIHLESAASVDVTFTLDLENTVGEITTGDYSYTPTEVFIRAGERTATVSLTALDDDVREEEEKFDLRLVSASEGVTVTVRSAVTVTISRSDQPTIVVPPVVVPPVVVPPVVVPPSGGGRSPEPEPAPAPLTVSLEPSERTVDEGDEIEVTARLSEASDEDITVTLTAFGGTADTDDHGLVMRESLTIEAGDLTAMFTISTTDDNIYEGDETLVLRLSSSADVERNARESTITIIDNDPVPTLSLEPNPSGREGGSVTVRARLSNPSAEAILVALTLEDGTAMLDSDYPPPVEFVTEIAPGAEFAEFIISTIDDTVYEPIETVLLQLIVVEGDVIEGTLAGMLSISDDEPVPTLSIEAPDEIVEGTTELVTIRLSGMAANPVTVRVSVGPDSNVSEDDYTLSPAEVTIEPGQLNATVMLSVVDDGRPEVSEILVLEVASDELEPVQHRITIPGLATALVDVDSEAEWCDPSGVACVDVTVGTYSEPLLLFIEQASDDTTAPTDFMYLSGVPLWDIEFLLESDPYPVVSELDGRVRVSFRAPRDLVEANGGTEMISIATLHEGSTEWELLETSYDEADDAYRFYAYTTGFSYFALIMIDEVSVVEPPVGPPNQPIPLWLLASIVLAVLLAIVIIVLVIHFRKRGSRPPSPPPSPSLLQLPAPAPQLPAPSPSPPQLSAPSPDPSEASVDEGEDVEDLEETVGEGEEAEGSEASVDEGEEAEDSEESVDEGEAVEDSEATVDEGEEAEDSEESVDEGEDVEDLEENRWRGRRSRGFGRER